MLINPWNHINKDERDFTSVQMNREELGQLEEREKQLQEKLETRKKQFHLLVSSIHQMQVIKRFLRIGD